jgi:transcriptional regulator with XRE-family HTH domain
MSQTTTILNVLKRYLKAKGITYNILAEKMGLSEATIKRLFAKQSFSLLRLEKICNILDLDFHDLAMMMKQDSQNRSKILSTDQEYVLAENPKLVTFFYFLVNGWSLDQIILEYEISKTEATGFLVKLDNLKLIEWQPGGRIRVLVSKNIFWQENGPLWNLYQKKIQKDFLDYPFDNANDRLIFSPGQFSEASLREIRKTIDKLVRQYNELAEMDSALPINERYSSGLMIGFRPWVFSMIASLRRRQGTKNTEG